MAGAPPVLAAVAGGRLPVAFEMDEREVTSLNRPAAVFVHAPRQSYLPLVALGAATAFQDSAPQVGPQGIWFSTISGVPLRWDLPLGLLYDAHGHGILPWRVLVRFRDFPSAQLLKSGLKETETMFFHSLKQALNLLNGSARSFMDMRQHDQEALWQAVETGRFIDAWRIAQPLISSEVHFAPIRLLSSRSFEVRQVPVPWEGTTLEDAIDALAAGRKWENPLVQGISPPLDSPVKELVRQMAAPDLFLYICVDM